MSATDDVEPTPEGWEFDVVKFTRERPEKPEFNDERNVRSPVIGTDYEGCWQNRKRTFDKSCRMTRIFIVPEIDSFRQISVVIAYELLTILNEDNLRMRIFPTMRVLGITIDRRIFHSAPKRISSESSKRYDSFIALA